MTYDSLIFPNNDRKE